MLRYIISLATVAAFVLHMVLGCCFHHVHSTQRADCGHSTAAAGAHSHAGHDHHAAASTSDIPAQCPAPQEHCTGEQCVFITAVNFSLMDLTAPAFLPVFADETMETELVLYPNAIDWDIGDLVLSPIRLHLLHQVMLI